MLKKLRKYFSSLPLASGPGFFGGIVPTPPLSWAQREMMTWRPGEKLFINGVHSCPVCHQPYDKPNIRELEEVL